MAKDHRDVSPHNVHYIKDYNYTLQVNRWFLRPIGMWPFETEATNVQKCLKYLLNILCHSLVIFTVVPCVMFIFLEDANTYYRIQAVGPMSHWLMGELNYCCLSFKTSDIFRCIQYVKTDWKTIGPPGDRELMVKSAKVGRSIAIIAAICMNVGILSDALVTGFQKLEYEEGNETHLMIRLPCPVYSNLMDVKHSPTNEIVYFLQFSAGLVVNSVTAGACGMAGVFAMHACGQLDVVTSELEELIKPAEEQKFVEKKMAAIVERHLRALKYCVMISRGVG